MRTLARHATLVAVAVAGGALAACSPEVERQAAVPADTAATTTSSTAAMTAAPATTATMSAASATAAAKERTAPTVEGRDIAADSVRGVVERVGSDPTTRLIVRAADGTTCMLAMDAPPPFEGLDVALWGTRGRVSATMLPGVSCTFAVERYAVRAVDGIAAVDGILRANGSAYTLEMSDGVRRPLRDVPAALRSQVGARLFWAGPLDRAPAAYGVLVPAR